MFTPTRDQARNFLFDTWSKYRRGEPLVGLEQTAVSVILLHPEYHAMLEQPERYLERDYGPEAALPIRSCICRSTWRSPSNFPSISRPESVSAMRHSCSGPASMTLCTWCWSAWERLCGRRNA